MWNDLALALRVPMMGVPYGSRRSNEGNTTKGVCIAPEAVTTLPAHLSSAQVRCTVCRLHHHRTRGMVWWSDYKRWSYP